MPTAALQSGSGVWIRFDPNMSTLFVCHPWSELWSYRRAQSWYIRSTVFYPLYKWNKLLALALHGFKGTRGIKGLFNLWKYRVNEHGSPLLLRFTKCQGHALVKQDPIGFRSLWGFKHAFFEECFLCFTNCSGMARRSFYLLSLLSFSHHPLDGRRFTMHFLRSRHDPTKWKRDVDADWYPRVFYPFPAAVKFDVWHHCEKSGAMWPVAPSATSNIWFVCGLLRMLPAREANLFSQSAVVFLDFLVWCFSLCQSRDIVWPIFHLQHTCFSK